MRKPALFALSLLAWVAANGSPSWAEPAKLRQVLVGGGHRPAAAMRRMVEWAGGAGQARVLVVTWASEIPVEVFEGISRSFLPHDPALIESNLTPPRSDAESAQAIRQIRDATGIFFSGGNQARIMAVMDRYPGIHAVLWEAFKSGKVVGGTSAGTAIASNPMIVEGGLARGMGFLGEGIIVDQHFLLRQREPRLLAAISSQSPVALGIGIDEDGALAIEDQRFAEVLGPRQVMIMEPKPASVEIRLLHPGDRYDLQTRSLLESGCSRLLESE